MGAREVVRRHEGEAVRIEVEALPDIDTEEDYARFVNPSDWMDGLL